MTLLLASLVLTLAVGLAVYFAEGHIRALGGRDRELEALEARKQQLEAEILDAVRLWCQLRESGDPEAVRVEAAVAVTERERVEVEMAITRHRVKGTEQRALGQ